MKAVKVKETGKIRFVTNNVAHGLVEAGKAEIVEDQGVTRPEWSGREYPNRKMSTTKSTKSEKEDEEETKEYKTKSSKKKSSKKSSNK